MALIPRNTGPCSSDEGDGSFVCFQGEVMWKFEPTANCIGAAWPYGRGLLWVCNQIRTED